MMPPSTNRRARRWRRLVGGLCAASLTLQMGCYTFKPLQTSIPATGTRIAVALNDRGRFTLGDRLGKEVDKVEGLLVGADSTNVSLEVYRTTDMRGNGAAWTGERVQVPRDAISGYQEREFSKRRTWLLVGTTVGVIVASMLAVDFNLFGGVTHTDPVTPPGGQSR